jgi:hypothetical protein
MANDNPYGLEPVEDKSNPYGLEPVDDTERQRLLNSRATESQQRDERQVGKQFKGVMAPPGSGADTRIKGETADYPLDESIPTDELPDSIRTRAMGMSADSSEAAAHLRDLKYDATDLGDYNISVKGKGGRYYSLQGKDRPFQRFVMDKAGDYQDMLAQLAGGVKGAAVGLPGGGPGMVAGGIIGAAGAGAASRASRVASGQYLYGMNKNSSLLNQAGVGALEGASQEVIAPVVRGISPMFRGGQGMKGIKEGLGNVAEGVRLTGKALRVPEGWARDSAGETGHVLSQLDLLKAKKKVVPMKGRIIDRAERMEPPKLDRIDAMATKKEAIDAVGGEQLTYRPKAREIADLEAQGVAAEGKKLAIDQKDRALRQAGLGPKAEVDAAAVKVGEERAAQAANQTRIGNEASAKVKEAIDSLRAKDPSFKTYTDPEDAARNAIEDGSLIEARPVPDPEATRAGLDAMFANRENTPIFYHILNDTYNSIPELGEIVNAGMGRRIRSAVTSGSMKNMESETRNLGLLIPLNELQDRIANTNKLLFEFMSSNPVWNELIRTRNLEKAANAAATMRILPDETSKLMDALEALAKSRGTSNELATAQAAYDAAQQSSRVAGAAHSKYAADTSGASLKATEEGENAALGVRKIKSELNTERAYSKNLDDLAVANKGVKHADAVVARDLATEARGASADAFDLKRAQLDQSGKQIGMQEAEVYKSRRIPVLGTYPPQILDAIGSTMERIGHWGSKGSPAFSPVSPRISEVMKEIAAAMASKDKSRLKAAYDRAVAQGVISYTNRS